MTPLLMLGAALMAPASSSSSGTLSIEGVAPVTDDGTIPLSVSVGDVDGDGVADRGTLLLRCNGASISEALFDKAGSARDSASGLASGKRTLAMPHVFEKAGAALAAMRPGYDLKPAKGARTASRKGYDKYLELALSAADGLCPLASSEAGKAQANKPRPNIQNN